MEKEKQTQVIYRIFAQNRDNQLIIEVVGKNIFISRTAHELISNPAFLHGFSSTEAALISYIAATEENPVL